MTEFQGKKFQSFLIKLKEETRKDPNRTTITIKLAASMLDIERTTLYQYFESSNLQRETVSKILTTFNVTENEIWGEDKSEQENSKSNAKPFNVNNDSKNMFVVPVKAHGGFLAGYESTVFMDSLEKASFPFVKGECFAFEVDGFSMYKDYVPGDYVVATPVDNLDWLSKGKVYVFQTIDGIILKCFDKIEQDFIHLYSLNKEYNPVKPIHLKDLKKVYFKEKVIKN